jgi:hypothetical protein
MFEFIIVLNNEAQILFILKVNSSGCTLIVTLAAETFIA